MNEVYELSTEANYLTTNNIWLLLAAAIQFILPLLIFIFFSFFPKKIKEWIPLCLFLVVAFPLFSAWNLWQITWIPQLVNPNEFFEDSLSILERFSLFYYGPFKLIIDLLFWITVISFLFRLERESSLRVKKVLFFTPILNLYTLWWNTNNKSISFLFFFLGSILFTLFYIVAPLLFVVEIDIYSWIIDLQYETQEDLYHDSTFSYTLYTDILTHIKASVPYVCSLFCLPYIFRYDQK